jgi:hypothetical protein
MKKVILSFDYELFFGIKSGTVMKTLIEPTNKIMDILERCGLIGNFFIDVLMIKYLKQNTDLRSTDDIKMIEEQLRDMIRRGHRIELHLHPHWVDAKYNGNGTWDFTEFKHYSLSSFSEVEIIQMFTKGVDYLNTIGSAVKSDYKVCAFRAGGWAVQPFKKLQKSFLAANIKIDSSSSYGAYNLHPNFYYDFRNIPLKYAYRFEDDVCKENEHGHFVEVPISFYRHSFIGLLVTFFDTLMHSDFRTKQTDGTHLRSDMPDINCKFKISYLIGLFTNYRMLNFSNISPRNIIRYLNQSKNDVVCFIDHPKDLTNSTIEGISKLKGVAISLTYIDLIKS